MTIRLIIAHPSAKYCTGLSKRFSREATFNSIDVVTTSEALERKLNTEPVDVIIVEQSLLRDLSCWPPGNVIVVVRRPDRESMMTALAHRACGYFLDTDRDDLLKWAVAARPGAFWIDPAIASQFINELASREPLQNSEGNLSPREQEVLELKVQGITNQQIAKRLFISETTVKKHVQRILQKCPQYRRWSKEE